MNDRSDRSSSISKEEIISKDHDEDDNSLVIKINDPDYGGDPKNKYKSSFFHQRQHNEDSESEEGCHH